MNKNIRQIIFLLKKKGVNLSLAESCTGGMLAQKITSVSGASKVFTLGIITYSDQMKIKFLKVPRQIIKKYGAVSKETCRSMVINLSKISKTTLNLAITGIAGPKGGTNRKPVGLVYIGIKKNKKIDIKKYLFKKQNRESVRRSSVKKSLELIKKFI
jgi:nicotinamide-nucleotide amidase